MCLHRFLGVSHYLDASALVRLIADDPDEMPGRVALQRYYWNHPNMYATSYCVVEALSAFKLKFKRHKIIEDQYVKFVEDFIRTVVGANLMIDEVSILLPRIISEAQRLIRRHRIDFIDSIQIVTILHGRFSPLDEDPKSILITADLDLAKAARAEGARVWEIGSEPAPT